MTEPPSTHSKRRWTGRPVKVERQVERRGDSEITTLSDDQALGESLEIYDHENGGVTLLKRNHRGEEMARVSMTPWIVDALREALWP